MTLGSHQTTIGKSQVHLTPRWILDRLGTFDLDPCAADPRPWSCATLNYTQAQDGLSLPWIGRVWLNPPYDRRYILTWMDRMGEHGNGIALLHARTETAWFDAVWEAASAVLFMADRIHFCRDDGTPHPANSGAPPVLVAYGESNVAALKGSGIAGRLVSAWQRMEPRALAEGGE